MWEYVSMPSEEFRRELSTTSDPTTAWQVLTDVPRLASWVSIVGDVEEKSRLETYTAVLQDRMGPFKLKANLDVDVSEVEEERHIRVKAAGMDRQVSSRIAVDATLSLEPTSAGTNVVVEGRYEVSGRVASMGSGMIKQKANKVMEEFFSRAAADLGTV